MKFLRAPFGSRADGGFPGNRPFLTASRHHRKNTTAMPFSHLGLHPDLLRGVRELGFTRPTPIRQEAIPPALAGRDASNDNDRRLHSRRRLRGAVKRENGASNPTQPRRTA